MTTFKRLRMLAPSTLPMLMLLCSCGGSGDSQAPPLKITADTAPAGTAGASYTQYQFGASGGTAPLSWTETGQLPPGLTFSGSGLLSGSPATAGTYPITVTVRDSSMPSLTANVEVSLTINDSTIVIAPSGPPTGTVSVAYPAFAFSASGGSPPYTWKASGAVPPGLTVGPDGSVSGIPTTAGTFAFSVTATDSAQTPVTSSASATQITIVTPGSLVLNALPAPPPGTGGSGYSFTFATTAAFCPLHGASPRGACRRGCHSTIPARSTGR